MNELGDLIEWQREVENFGGRLDTRSAPSRKLTSGNLGSTKTIVTTGFGALDTSPVTLAEMTLSSPVEVDLVFSYPNIEQLVQEVLLGNLDPGDGFVRITWGVPGAPQLSADVDGAMGWRHPFVASYLRAEYFPADLTVEPYNRKPPSMAQSRNLQVQAVIAPKSGAPTGRLTRTRNFGNIAAAGGVGGITIPRFARAYAMRTGIVGLQNPRFTAQIFGFGADLLHTRESANSSSSTLWFNNTMIAIPQRSNRLSLTNNEANVLANASAVFELGL